MRVAHHHHRVPRAGNGAAHEQQIALRVHQLHPQLANRLALVAHVPGHFLALHHAARERPRADGPDRAAAVALSVRLLSAAEPVAPHRALEAAPLRRGHDVHEIAGLELADAQPLPDAVVGNVVRLELAQPPDTRAGRREVPRRRLVQLLHAAEADLHRLVAVPRRRPNLRDDARPHFQSGDGNDSRLRAEEVRHPDFLADQPFDHRVHNLMEMSTPAGICSRVSASIVLEFGSRMSTSRLCVRSSKCSRESLSM